GRRRRRGLRLAGHVLYRRRARRRAGLSAAAARRAAPRRARRGGLRARLAGTGRLAPQPGAPPLLRGEHGRPGDLHVRDGRAGDVDADLLRARARHSAGERGVDLRRAARGGRLPRDAARRGLRRGRPRDAGARDRLCPRRRRPGAALGPRDPRERPQARRGGRAMTGSTALWAVRLGLVVVGLAGWFWTQRLIARRAWPE